MAKLKRAKRANRPNPRSERNNVIPLENYRQSRKINVIPRTITQEDYLLDLQDEELDIVFAVGPAGTGKSYLCTLMAIKALRENKIEKIIITRPAVSVDEQHGFLPGSLVEKMAPWTRPIIDVFREYYSVKQIETMIKEEIIEIAPLAYMRGRTFKNAWIIGDEMQNTTPSQMKMLLTRIGDDSRIILTGDIEQHDRGFEHNGLKDAINRLDDRKGISINEFFPEDVVRHRIIETVLNAYADEE